MEPQAGENFNEDTIVNKEVGPFVWVIKKIISGLEMVALVEIWSSMKAKD